LTTTDKTSTRTKNLKKTRKRTENALGNCAGYYYIQSNASETKAFKGLFMLSGQQRDQAYSTDPEASIGNI